MEKLFELGLTLPLGHVLGYVALVLFLYMTLWSLFALAKKRADLADIAWGPGFILVAWSSFILGQPTVYGLILNILVTAWAIRLAFHLYLRNRNRDEDFRYQTLKNKWTTHFHLKMFTEVFLLQGCILYVIALPIIWIQTHPADLPLQILWIALSIWLFGFAIESLADLQLARFKNDSTNKGKLLTVGLWSYVRHPNYLGELMQWWAIWLTAAFLPFGWALIISPLLLTFLIVKISGVKALEEKFMKHPEFKAYMERTPSLMPPSLMNGLLYAISWFALVIFGNKISPIVSILIASGSYALQLYLFAEFDRACLRICIPLSIIALSLGLLQELVFIHSKILVYPNNPLFPPVWIIALYPLFSLTLNSSLAFLNNSLWLPFFLGGFGALLSYLSGENLGSVQLYPPLAYPGIFLLWGGFLTLLILVNRKLKYNRSS